MCSLPDTCSNYPPTIRVTTFNFRTLAIYEIEADSFKQVTEKEVISFIRKNIIYRYEVPSEIACDNGTQFVGKRTIAFCAEWNINLVTSTPGYPKANVQAESSNKVVISCLKKKLKKRRGRWAKELPLVLWADMTTPKTSTGPIPYSLVYGREAVIPVEEKKSNFKI
ncbi:uncharacterized protein LOC141607528 [Silene latifolia]|uniref:uncharacterized protein LOC141607528 n=1 Tax=Silene latifolia TaxID=37657 RepID=UPI003D7836A9